MKKILFLNHNQENFGTYYRCLFLAKGLSERKYKVTMICASGKNFDLLIRKKKINENFSIITLPRIKYHSFFTGQIIFRLPLAIFYTLFFRYDICHAFTVAQPQIAIPAWIAKKIRRKKLIIDWDDAWAGGFALHHPWIVKETLAFFENKTPAIADNVTYVSEFLGNKLKELKIKKITKIPNGCNIEKIKLLDKSECRRKLNISPDKKILVAMGNTYMDCLGVFFRSLNDVFQKDPDVCFYMLSNVAIPKKFKNLWEKIKGRTILTGRVDFSDLTRYLGAADALLLPMENENIEKARFPMRFGDYLCAGRPIVSNAVGEVEYYIKKYNCGLASDPSSSEELSRNILKILSDKELSDIISLNARKLAEGDLNWDNIVEKLEKEVYLKV